jgi:hypothetical protein
MFFMVQENVDLGNAVVAVGSVVAIALDAIKSSYLNFKILCDLTLNVTKTGPREGIITSASEGVSVEYSVVPEGSMPTSYAESLTYARKLTENIASVIGDGSKNPNYTALQTAFFELAQNMVRYGEGDANLLVVREPFTGSVYLFYSNEAQISNDGCAELEERINALFLSQAQAGDADILDMFDPGMEEGHSAEVEGYSAAFDSGSQQSAGQQMKLGGLGFKTMAYSRAFSFVDVTVQPGHFGLKAGVAPEMIYPTNPSTLN